METVLERKDKVDSYGRKIVEGKATISFNGEEIIFKGSIRKVDYNGEEFLDYFQPDVVPPGFAHRKAYEYFYAPTLINVLNILRYKSENQSCGLTASFVMLAHNKIKQYNESNKALEKVKGLTLNDIKAIQALPIIGTKIVPDFMHQRIASQYAYHLPQCALLEEQGLGKTKTAIETFLVKQEEGIIDRVLVVAPLSVLGQMGWIKQIKEYTKHVSYIPLRGTREQKLAILNGEHGEFDIYLTNYEGLLNIEEELLEWIDNRTMIILDETSKIKNYSAKRTQVCIKIGTRTDTKMILTGTPVTQSAYDMFAQWKFLDCGDTFGSSYEKFLDKYFYRSGFKIKPISKKHLEEIHDLAFRKAIRFTKDQALDLPPKTYQTRVCEMTPIQADYYDKILRQELIRLSELEVVTAQIILVVILRLQQITSGFLSTKDLDGNPLEIKPISGPNPKINELEDLLEELDGKPTVIWSRFRYDVDQISKLLEHMNISYVTYIGGIPELVRNENERKFMQGEVQAFVSIPSAGGFGMNLQRASYAIYYSNDYSLQNRLQSEDRIHRLGQKGNATIIDLCAIHPDESTISIDLLVHDVLKGKKDIADIVTGDWKKILSKGL